MQVGSLVECISAYMDYSVADPISKGEILTVKNMFENIEIIEGIANKTGKILLEFYEKHTDYCKPIGTNYGYDSEDFVEIQPPMEVSIEEIISQKDKV